MTKRQSITKAKRARVFLDHGGVCHICGRKIAEGEKWDVEHPKAIGLGGSDKLEDLRPAHIDCHKPKTATEVRIMRKADRIAKKHTGTHKPKTKLSSRGWSKPAPENKVARLARKEAEHKKRMKKK